MSNTTTTTTTTTTTENTNVTATTENTNVTTNVTTTENTTTENTATATTTTTTNATVKFLAITNLDNIILENRQFASRKVTAEFLSTHDVKLWHSALDSLHSACYRVYADTVNKTVQSSDHTDSELNASVDYSEVFASLRTIFALIGKVNDANLRATSSLAFSIIAHSCTTKTQKSSEVQFQESVIRNAKTWLRANEGRNILESAKQSRQDDIAKAQSIIASLKDTEGNYIKVNTKTSASAWYKFCEDFFADMIERRLMMTEEELQAEAEAKRKARNKKNHARQARRNSAK